MALSTSTGNGALASATNPSPNNSFPFSNLPWDVVYEVADQCSAHQLNLLARCNKGFLKMLKPRLYNSWKEKQATASVSWLYSVTGQSLLNEDATETPLCWSIRQDKYEAVKALLGNKANINTAVTVAGMHYPPLHWAIKWNRGDIATLLVNSGADVDGKGGALLHGRTPLMYAVEKGRVETVAMLLKKGADVNSVGDLPSKTLRTVLHMLPRMWHFRMARTFWDHDPEDEDTSDMDEPRRLFGWDTTLSRIIRFLLDAGANLDLPDKDGKTPRDLMRERHVFCLQDFTTLVAEWNRHQNHAHMEIL